MKPISAPNAASPVHPGFPLEPIVEHLMAQPDIQRVPSPKLSLFMCRKLLSPAQCERLIEQIDINRSPSTIADNYGDNSYRTSETCHMDGDNPTVAQVNELISSFSGLDPAYGEPIQGQRYAVGQEFKAHTDYFEPNGQDFARYCSTSGNRTWTVMIYLNEPEAGGSTRFKAIDKIVKPEAGKVLAWSNLRADGRPNPATIHHGMKVRAGTKYILTKWFRERHWA